MNCRNEWGIPVIPEPLLKRLDHHIHGLLADIGVLEQRLDSFVDQEDIVERFIAAWDAVLIEVESSVISQIERGKKKVKIA